MQACTAKMHSLSHITKFVEFWGPLWTHSLFGFENFNGHLRKLFHGTRQVLDQLVFSVKAEQSLFFQTKKLKNESEATTQFFSKYIRFHGSTAKLEGKCKRVVLPRKIHQAIEDYAGKRLTNYHQIVSRLRRNPSSVIHSEYFAKKLRVHDSSVCCFRDITGEVGFARILVFESTYSIAIAIPYVTAEH